MTLVVDLDNTLLKSEREDYAEPAIFLDEVKAVNDAFSAGHTIIIHTGRNWDKYAMTKAQLQKFHIKHDELVMGKPQGTYVDHDAKTSIAEALA